MAIDPFTGLPKEKPTIIERVKNVVHRSGGADLSNYYTKAQVDAAIAAASPTAAQINTALDTALTRTTGNPLRDGFGGDIDLGTNGDMIFRYQRVGRIVDLWIQIWADDDWAADSGGFFLIPFADLPYTPLAIEAAPSGITTVNAATAGAFGYMSYAPNNPATAAAPAITGAGGGSIAFIIIVNDGSGGLANLMSGSNPVDITSVEWQYTGYMRYVAASAA